MHISKLIFLCASCLLLLDIRISKLYYFTVSYVCKKSTTRCYGRYFWWTGLRVHEFKKTRNNCDGVLVGLILQCEFLEKVWCRNANYFVGVPLKV